MPHTHLPALTGQRPITSATMEVVVSPIPYVLGPLRARLRRPAAPHHRRPAPQAHPPRSHACSRVILALGVVAVVVGTLPLVWRAAPGLSDRRAEAITQATLDGFGGAIGGAIGPNRFLGR